jgi:hypothetical protein
MIAKTTTRAMAVTNSMESQTTSPVIDGPGRGVAGAGAPTGVGAFTGDDDSGGRAGVSTSV